MNVKELIFGGSTKPAAANGAYWLYTVSTTRL